jgi:2-oxoglutarate ferredoxin oxidoreductase subunit alpha
MGLGAVISEHSVADCLKSGSYACAEGAIAAGCGFYAAYPTGPAPEVAECMFRRLPQIDGECLQLWDEVGSVAAALGASRGGMKSMTAISGPEVSAGVCENIALAVETGIPCVLLSIQNAEASNRLLSCVSGSEGEMAKAKSKFHVDSQTIGYAPNSVQEMFDLTVKAFNMAEKYRAPIFVIADQILVNMTDTFVVPSLKELEITQRREPAGDHLGFSPSTLIEDLPPIALVRRIPQARATNLGGDRLRGLNASRGRTRNYMGGVPEVEHCQTEDANAVVVAYGSMSRSALLAVNEARHAQKKVGLLRLVTPWPFPKQEIERLSVEKSIVLDVDDGEIERLVRQSTSCPVTSLRFRAGTLASADEITRALVRE